MSKRKNSFSFIIINVLISFSMVIKYFLMILDHMVVLENNQLIGTDYNIKDYIYLSSYCNKRQA